MGFTMWLAIIYIVLIALTVLSFVKKRKAILAIGYADCKNPDSHPRKENRLYYID